AFRRQLRNHFLRGIGVNLHRPSQHAHRRERVARTELAAEHGFLGGEDYLFRDGNSGLRDEPERNHMCNMTRVTVDVKRKAEECPQEWGPAQRAPRPERLRYE